MGRRELGGEQERDGDHVQVRWRRTADGKAGKWANDNIQLYGKPAYAPKGGQIRQALIIPRKKLRRHLLRNITDNPLQKIGNMEQILSGGYYYETWQVRHSHGYYYTMSKRKMAFVIQHVEKIVTATQKIIKRQQRLLGQPSKRYRRSKVQKLGAWYNPETKTSLSPDLNHPDPIPLHWDYKGPLGEFRIFPHYSKGV